MQLLFGNRKLNNTYGIRFKNNTNCCANSSRSSTITGLVAGNTTASVTFTAPAFRRRLNNYRIHRNFKFRRAELTATPAPRFNSDRITNLVDGTVYTFTVTATNSAGTGVASAASSSVTPSAGCTATGGTITTYTDVNGTHEVHTFSSSGTFTVSGTCSSQILVVAGGGSGATCHTSGAGEEGRWSYYSHNLTAQAYTVTVGAGRGPLSVLWERAQAETEAPGIVHHLLIHQTEI